MLEETQWSNICIVLKDGNTSKHRAVTQQCLACVWLNAGRGIEGLEKIIDMAYTL
jgi:hypothetical protein